MAFFYQNSLQQNLGSLPELIVTNSNSFKNGIKNRYLYQNEKKSFSKVDIKSLTRIPAESPAQIYKKAQQIANEKENSKLNSNLRGYSTPKNIKSMCSAISEKQSSSTVCSINKNNPQRKLNKQTTLNFDEPKSLKQSQIFSSFSDLCENQSSSCKTPSDDTQSQATSDTGYSHDSGDKSPTSKTSEEKEHAKQLPIARLKSFKDINDAHNRHIEQKENLIAKYKNLSQSLDAELQKRNDLIASQNKQIASLQNSVESLTEQLTEQELNVGKTLKQYSIIRNEINEQRKEAPEFQTLLDENIFLKQYHQRSLQANKSLEDSHNDYKKLLSNINNWAAISSIQNPTPENLDQFMISKVSDYKKRTAEQQELQENFKEIQHKYNILKEDFDRLEQEKRILKATIEMQECRIESIKENDGYSKVFKKLTGISMEGVENDLIALKKSIQDRQSLDNNQTSDDDKKALMNIEYIKMQVENLKINQLTTMNHLKSIETKLKDQYVNVEKYKFIEELDAMESHARKILQCNRCNSALYNSITHVPCGHSFCMDCHEDRKQKIELNDQIPFDQKQNRICACSLCGQDKKGNWVFKNQQMDQIQRYGQTACFSFLKNVK